MHSGKGNMGRVLIRFLGKRVFEDLKRHLLRGRNCLKYGNVLHNLGTTFCHFRFAK